MNQYEVFHHFRALKLHFTTSYDYKKYRGRVKYRPHQYKERKDKYIFKKISEHKDPFGFCLANVLNDHSIYAGELLTSESSIIYQKWNKINQSLFYHFKCDLDKIENVRKSLLVHDGNYPILLEKFYQNEISSETLIILNHIIHFTKIWNKKIAEDILWPQTFLTLKNYSQFVSFDVYKYKIALKNAITQQI